MNTVFQSDIAYFRAKCEEIGQKLFGIDAIIHSLMIALVMRGHVLLEGNPGLGKTMLVRRMADALEIGGFGRIQFTPDLMPSDITGTEMPEPAENGFSLVFKEGPIFCRLLLADEINRATPKTQSAMLEAMAEFQCTVLGRKEPLVWKRQVTFTDQVDGASKPLQTSAVTPFLVLATQNPVEQEGTYSLPEAQLDRFLMKVRMPFPERDTLERILNAEIGKLAEVPGGEEAAEGDAQAERQAAADEEEALGRLDRFSSDLRKMRPSSEVSTHILNMVLASIGDHDSVEGVDDPKQKEALKTFVRERADYPLGPRAATALGLATLGWSALKVVELGEFNVEEPAIQAASMEGLAAVVVPCLRHRIGFRGSFQDLNDDTAVDDADRKDDLVREFARLCAPTGNGYALAFGAALDAAKTTQRM